MKQRFDILSLFVVAMAPSVSAATRLPNIVVILVDDRVVAVVTAYSRVDG